MADHERLLKWITRRRKEVGLENDRDWYSRALPEPQWHKFVFDGLNSLPDASQKRLAQALRMRVFQLNAIADGASMEVPVR